jgi:hypothetical protein
MTDNLALAQAIAWNLAQTLMVSITLFRCTGGYSVVPTAEFDGTADTIVTEFDPFER